jgi:hypothetical protein
VRPRAGLDAVERRKVCAGYKNKRRKNKIIREMDNESKGQVKDKGTE